MDKFTCKIHPKLYAYECTCTLNKYIIVQARPFNACGYITTLFTATRLAAYKAQFGHNSRAKRNSIACLHYSHSVPFARFGFAVSPIHIAVSIHIDTLSAILFGSLTFLCNLHYSHYFRVYTIHATCSVANSFCSSIIACCIYLTRTNIQTYVYCTLPIPSAIRSIY